MIAGKGYVAAGAWAGEQRPLRFSVHFARTAFLLVLAPLLPPPTPSPTPFPPRHPTAPEPGTRTPVSAVSADRAEILALADDAPERRAIQSAPAGGALGGGGSADDVWFSRLHSQAKLRANRRNPTKPRVDGLPITKGPDPDWDDNSTVMGDIAGVHRKFKTEWADAVKLKLARGGPYPCYSEDDTRVLPTSVPPRLIIGGPPEA